MNFLRSWMNRSKRLKAKYPTHVAGNEHFLEPCPKYLLSLDAVIRQLDTERWFRGKISLDRWLIFLLKCNQTSPYHSKYIGLLVYWFVCHKMYKAKEKKLFKLSWRGSPREATGLIRNGLPQLNS